LAPLLVFDQLIKIEELLREVAAHELMPRYKRVSAERKYDGSIVTAADIAVQAALAAGLPKIVDAPVLGEEMPSLAQRSLWRSARTLWCVDPLDGTGNFAHGKPTFGISVALMNGRRSVAGVVFDPNRNEMFTAVARGGAYLNRQRIRSQASCTLGDAVIELGRYRQLGRVATALKTHPPGARLQQSGSSVLQWCHAAVGRVDAIVHAGECPWDYAAGALILQEAGGRLATLKHDDFWRSAAEEGAWEQSVIAARHPALFAEWKRWVRAHA
jgi:myo-inositol-1(or 4)-monophosphatase